MNLLQDVDFQSEWCIEAERRVAEYLSGEDAHKRERLLAYSEETPCIVDRAARIMEVPADTILAGFCRGNTAPMIDPSGIKVPDFKQTFINGIPALLASIAPWGLYTFLTPLPFIDKAGADKILQEATGALKLAFCYCTPTSFFQYAERLRTGGRLISAENRDATLEKRTVQDWWSYLIQKKIFKDTDPIPESEGQIIEKLPHERKLSGEDAFVVSSLRNNIPYINFTKSSVLEDIPQIPPAVQRHYGITPLSKNGNFCTLACERLLTTLEKGELSSKGLRLGYVLADPDSVRQAIATWESRRLSAGDLAKKISVDDTGTGLIIEEIDITELVKRSGEENPTVVELVQSIIVYGMQNNATDIHISTHPNRMRVRFRIDGFLSEYPHQIDTKLSRQVISRVKIMGGIDTQFSPVPQDGKFSIAFQGREFDVRVNTAPTVYGDKAVLRLLPKRFRLPTLDELGFLLHERQIIQRVIDSDHGMLVICGPTGAGKSTTLAAAIGMVDSDRYVVVTGEQPVELRMPNIEQTNVTAGIENPNGLTFARFLEAALRQDPDYIMIGETRDTETASQVVRAALTGHVVLTTLHTNSAPSAPGRLVDLGVQPFLLKEALTAVVAQRLLPRLCTNCSVTEDGPSEEKLAKEGIDPEWFRGEASFRGRRGCAVCRGTGYHGRIGIFEGYYTSDPIRSVIGDHNANASYIRTAMREQGGRTLFEQASHLYARGITDFVSALAMKSDEGHERRVQ